MNIGPLTPAGSVACRSVNALPFQASATGVPVPVLLVTSVESPVTTQEVTEKQCRPENCVSVFGFASGTVVRAHLVPFQVQMIWTLALAVSLAPLPMATQLLTATQDTEVAAPSVCAGRGGAAIGVSVVPFQASANGAMPGAEFVSASPTTRQLVAALQDTPVGMAYCAPLGILAATAFQDPACSRAANSVMLPELPLETSCTPTVRQAVGDAQEIAIPTVTSEVLPLACGRAADSRSREEAMRRAALLAGYPAVIAWRSAVSPDLPPAVAVAVPAVPLVPVPAMAGTAQPSRAAVAATSPDITILRT